MSGPIVLGYDGSPSANAALQKTIALASQTSSHVDVVFGVYITPLGGTGGGSIREAVAAVGEQAVSRARADLEAAGVEVETHVAQGKPADVILAVADKVGASLIAVGTVGEEPISGALFGSVVLGLVQRSKIPLLVVPVAEDE
jgi:nucleotide-binding universal stress UspA family protein